MDNLVNSRLLDVDFKMENQKSNDFCYTVEKKKEKALCTSFKIIRRSLQIQITAVSVC